VVRVALSGDTRKALVTRLQEAYGNHATRLIRRIHALLGLGDGKSVGAMAEALGVGEQTVRDWLHAFVLDGVASLIYRPRVGRPAKLSPGQRQELAQLLATGPEAAGYAGACWTAGMIADLIHLRFKVDYAPRYVRHLLGALGFSYQKGEFAAADLDDEAALLWLEETGPELLRLARGKRAVILFGDEASFAQWGGLGHTGAPKGAQPTVRTSGIRKAHRVFGLLDCFGGAPHTRGLDGKVNSETYRAFLERALTQVAGHLILIQDNASYHTSADLRAFYAAHADRLTVYQLPPYSPDLNPLERLWKKAKNDATHLRYFPTLAALVAQVTATRTSFSGKPHELTALAGEYRELTSLAA
jgi:transposase